MSDVALYNDKVFEDIKHIDDKENEYWEARELQKVLEYKEWRNFQKVLDKAMIACKLSNNNVSNHFVGFNKTVPMPSGAKPKTIIDYKLSRYACYLIVQNANPKFKVVALGQTYFAIQTRKMELSEEEYLNLSEDEKRLYRRKQTRNGNKILYKIAKEKV